MMKKPVVIAWSLGAVLAAALIIKETSQPQGGTALRRTPAVTAVEVATVQPRVMDLRAEAVGTAHARESVLITASVSDTIDAIYFEDGQPVEQGDVLAVLNHNEEEAELKAAQATLAEQQREVKRLRGLIATNAVSQSLLDERLTLQETAEHRVAAAQARLRDRTIRAPFAGVLGLRQVSPGALVSPGTVITTLDAIQTMKLDFAVPAIHLGRLAPGQTVRARSPAFPGREFTGKVMSIDSRVNEVDRSIQVRAELPNSDGAIKPGLLLHVELIFAQRETLTVPESAIVPMRDRHYVYRLDGEPPRPSLQEVSIGVRRPGVVEIVAGLEAGQRIVSRGTHTINPKSVLNIVNSTEG
jgi:membrane fusion protein, multidrug efflux system